MNRPVLIIFLGVLIALYTCETKAARTKCTGGPNDRWTNCGSACEPTCQRPKPTICTMQCKVNTCRCEPNYVRRETDGYCVILADCNRREN